MKKIHVMVLVLLTFSFTFAMMSPELETIITNANQNDLIPVNIILKEQFDSDALNQMVNGLPKKIRRIEVARILKQFSEEKQKATMNYLKPYIEKDRVIDVTPLWIVNAIHCNATKYIILELSERSDVWFVDYDLIYSPGLLPKPVKPDVTGTDEITWGVRKIQAPEVWALGYTGAGIIAGLIDTGVNYNHLDLADHMWADPNYPLYGWNFENNTNDPIDIRGHGSHCAGTIASDGTAGTQCGVAPDCQIMACRVRTVADSTAENQVWQAMEFVVSPPLSPDNGGDLISMSLGWYISWNPRQAIWRTGCNNVGAAGIPMIVAAGNERSISPPNSCRCPGNVPSPWRHPENGATGALSDVISIGATDSLDDYASFSSRGPVTWQNIAPFNDYPYPPGLTKPDVCAPGVDVKSCHYTSNNTYQFMDGTSMATPHTAGTVALMLQKNPELLPWQVDSILEKTGVDLGPIGKDYDFGSGRIDALNAVNYTQLPGGARYLRHFIIDNSPGNLDSIINPAEGIEMPLWVINLFDYGLSEVRGILRLGEPDSNVVITDSIKYFGNIGAGESAYTSLDGYNFAVSAACTNGYPLPFQLICLDTLDSAWTSDFALAVGTPILFVDGMNVYDSLPGGNNNGRLDPGDSAFLEIGIRNQGMGNGYNVTVHLISTDSRFLIWDSIGTYDTILHDTIVYNTSDRFQVSANSSIPPGTQISCTLRIYADGYPVQNQLLQLEIIGLIMTDPIPDGPRIPPLYYAYEDIDTAFVEHPNYEWFEIDTVGTRLTPIADDQTVQVDLPPLFGPWKYYGQRYTQISICSNGWIAPGFTSSVVNENLRLPDSTLTNPNGMICANWDDLYPNDTGVGGIYYYHDSTNHRFIIEYDNVPYFDPSRYKDKFQIIIYDTTVAAFDGHNEIIVQYMTANYYHSSTVGIEDPTNTIAICCLYNDTLHRGCAPWTRGKVIKYTTDSPYPPGIVWETQKLGICNSELIKIAPNPFKDLCQVRLQIKQQGNVNLKIYDITGREVRNLISTSHEPGSYTYYWNARDDNGRKVANGIYFYQLETPNENFIKKMILVQ